MTTVAVFGLGYVGAVTMAALADSGHNVVGVDVNPTKVKIINAGRSPVIEDRLDQLLRQGVSSGAITATTNAAEAVAAASISLICVGTPSRRNGSLNLDHVERVCEQIGSALAETADRHVVVARSTMIPGSTEGTVIPTLERASGLQAGRDFGVCYNPEFLREGTSIEDFYDPPFTIIGASDDISAGVLADLYSMLDQDVTMVPIKVAEMVKYASNAYHALKVTFANEIGSICKQEGIDSHLLMDVFSRDTKLNISSAYLKPGFAFGGSCLPKDVRALVYLGRSRDVHTPVLESILLSNQLQIERALELVRATEHKRVGVLGLSFKAGTDDLRESPIVELTERLIGKGYAVRIFDRNVSLAQLHGANREYIDKEIPHLSSLLSDSVEEVIAESDVLIIGNADPAFAEALRTPDPDQHIIDLVRLDGKAGDATAYYHGITW